MIEEMAVSFCSALGINKFLLPKPFSKVFLLRILKRNIVSGFYFFIILEKSSAQILAIYKRYLQ